MVLFPRGTKRKTELGRTPAAASRRQKGTLSETIVRREVFSALYSWREPKKLRGVYQVVSHLLLHVENTIDIEGYHAE